MSRPDRTLTVVPLSSIQADRLVEWYRLHDQSTPEARRATSLKATFSLHAGLVKGKKCLHADADPGSGELGPICGRGVERDSPHGWLCWRHYAQAHGIEVPPPAAKIPLILKKEVV